MKRSVDLLSDSTIQDLRRAWEVSSTTDTTYRFPLVKSPFGFEEILEALDSLLSTRLTMGSKVNRFESEFAEYLGVKQAVMVNSGSSANLVALHVLSNPLTDRRIRPGDEVLVPSLTWSTSIFPILDVGATPVLVDSDSDTFNLSPEAVRESITEKTRAILAVHLLGNPCDMSALRKLAKEHGLFLIEDCCEAHGATYHKKKVGSFGDIGTYSFFFSHHISTIEGGMVVTNTPEYAETARSLRAHGWVRDLENRRLVADRYPHIDPRFLFVNRGFNLRPTEIQGAFGLHQLGRLDGFVEGRRAIAKGWNEGLSDLSEDLGLQCEQTGGKHSYFGYAFVLRNGGHEKRRQVAAELERLGVETRVIMGGSMAEQPAMQLYDFRASGMLPNAHTIGESGVFIGIHPDYSPSEASEVLEIVRRVQAEVR